MTELKLNVDDKLEKFHGDDSLAFEYVLESMMSEDELEMLRFEQIVRQIQQESQRAGGVSGKEIDAYIAAYRKKKRGKEQEIT